METTSLWPWLVVAGAGALHGLMPTSGWVLAAASGVRSGDARQVWRALGPLMLGHVVSVALVAAVVALGVSMELWPLQVMACTLVAAFVLHHMLRRDAPAPHTPAGRAGLALWSFMGTTLHGSGLMLVPALVPLCVSDSPAREITASGSLWLAAAAIGVHGATMLGVVAACAVTACRGIGAARRWTGRLAGYKRTATSRSAGPEAPPI